MDNDTNLNGVFRHAWSPRNITKVVAQVKFLFVIAKEG